MIKKPVQWSLVTLIVCSLLVYLYHVTSSKSMSNVSDGSILSCSPTNVPIRSSVPFTIKREFSHSSRCPIPIDQLENNKPSLAKEKASTLFEFHLVYFVNCKIRNNYGEWMTGMLMGTRGSSLPTTATLYIVATSHNCTEEKFLHETVNAISTFRKDAQTILECHNDEKETYEYHGIHKAWKIGQEQQQQPDKNNSNAIIGYFHSKGVTRADNFNDYVVNHSHPTLHAMGRYEQVADAFALFPWIEKAGVFCGGCGWVWFNFWYARASYVNMLMEPVLTERRHYYEAWLGYKGSGREKYGDGGKVWNETGVEYVGNSMAGCYALMAPVNMGYSYDPFDGSFAGV